MNLKEIDIARISKKASDIRISIVEMLVKAKSGHTAGPLDMADVFATLYFKVLRHNPENPSWAYRDRVILSGGHICPVLYATMAHSGYFPISELLTLRKFGSRLQGHPHREFLPGIETSSGPLGCGLSQAIGMALVDRNINPINYFSNESSPKNNVTASQDINLDIKDKVNNKTNTVFKNKRDLEMAKTDRYFYTIMGDGEMNEGNVWEALMLLGKEKLHRVITIIDRNTIQIDGNTETVMPLESLSAKLIAFNLNVIEIDGHNIIEVYAAINQAKSIINRATIIIAHTIPSRGVIEWEGDYHWHGKPPTDEEGVMAIKELII